MLIHSVENDEPGRTDLSSQNTWLNNLSFCYQQVSVSPANSSYHLKVSLCGADIHRNNAFIPTRKEWSDWLHRHELLMFSYRTDYQMFISPSQFDWKSLWLYQCPYQCVLTEVVTWGIFILTGLLLWILSGVHVHAVVVGCDEAEHVHVRLFATGCTSLSVQC